MAQTLSAKKGVEARADHHHANDTRVDLGLKCFFAANQYGPKTFAIPSCRKRYFIDVHPAAGHLFKAITM